MNRFLTGNWRSSTSRSSHFFLEWLRLQKISVDEVVIDCVFFFIQNKAKGANIIGRKIRFDALLRMAKNAL